MLSCAVCGPGIGQLCRNALQRIGGCLLLRARTLSSVALMLHLLPQRVHFSPPVLHLARCLGVLRAQVCQLPLHRCMACLRLLHQPPQRAVLARQIDQALGHCRIVGCLGRGGGWRGRGLRLQLGVGGGELQHPLPLTPQCRTQGGDGALLLHDGVTRRRQLRQHGAGGGAVVVPPSALGSAVASPGPVRSA